MNSPRLHSITCGGVSFDVSQLTYLGQPAPGVVWRPTDGSQLPIDVFLRERPTHLYREVQRHGLIFIPDTRFEAISPASRTHWERGLNRRYEGRIHIEGYEEPHSDGHRIGVLSAHLPLGFREPTAFARVSDVLESSLTDRACGVIDRLLQGALLEDAVDRFRLSEQDHAEHDLDDDPETLKDFLNILRNRDRDQVLGVFEDRSQNLGFTNMHRSFRFFVRAIESELIEKQRVLGDTYFEVDWCEKGPCTVIWNEGIRGKSLFFHWHVANRTNLSEDSSWVYRRLFP